MVIPSRSNILKFFVKRGALPADLLLYYDDNCYEWYSGFSNFAHVAYALVRSAQPEVVVEIGSAYGRSTCFIASALQRNKHGKLFSIDPHERTSWNDGRASDDTFWIVRTRLQELKLLDYVEQLRMYSSDALKEWSRPVDMLLLDGSHSYKDIKNDFLGFRPHLKANGMVLFHDTMWEYHRDSKWYRSDQGVPRLVQELQDQGFPMVTLLEGWGLTILQNASGGFRLIPTSVR